MADARLLITSCDPRDDEESVEIIHDVLLREWNLLLSWIAEDRNFLAWYQEFEKHVQLWIETGLSPSKRDTDKLLRGSDLKQALDYLHARSGELNQTERDFITASQIRRRFKEDELFYLLEVESQQ